MNKVRKRTHHLKLATVVAVCVLAVAGIWSFSAKAQCAEGDITCITMP